MRIDDELWSEVRWQRWKWQEGRVAVRGIIWHATRSGIQRRPPEAEYRSTLNWFRSPSNVVRDSAGNPWYGAMSHYVIGGGRVCRVVPEELVPRFSAGVHDFQAISVEVAQATRDTPFAPQDIELCRALARELSDRYRFQLGRIPFVDGENRGWPGEVGHEDTAQGRGQGKSDPGPLFWAAYEEDVMSSEFEEALLLRLFAGTERPGSEGREERLAYARLKLAESGQSLADLAASAIVVALNHGHEDGRVIFPAGAP
ncbi:MAG TPA: N-acetylmuramoyl-L-alanine amidase [Tepidiformaceae bacterium]|nr:N-acetylmuramoyl-L-alanine amidase [Tepidiformaceae bacterium]